MPIYAVPPAEIDYFQRVAEATREKTPDEIKAREELARKDEAGIIDAEQKNKVGNKKGYRPRTEIVRQYYGVVDLVAAGISSDRAARVIRQINHDLKLLGVKPMSGLAHRDALARYFPGIVLEDRERRYEKDEIENLKQKTINLNKRAERYYERRRAKRTETETAAED